MGTLRSVICILGLGILGLLGGVLGQDYGPVSLDAIDPLTLSWNQIHWLVRDQIKEVEEIKQEHDEIYNQITGCFGLEKCLGEFDLLDIKPGSKLYELGLRYMDVQNDLVVRKNAVNNAQGRLQEQIRDRERQREILEEQRRQEEQRMAKERWRGEEERRRGEEERRRGETERQRLEEERRRQSSSSSFSSSSSSFSSRGSSSRTSSSRGSSTRPLDEFPDDTSSWTSFFSNSTSFGPKPQVYETSYKYSSRNRQYNTPLKPN